MSLLKNYTYQKVIFIGLIIFYANFFINLITDDRSSWSLTYLIIALFILLLCKTRKIQIHPIIFIIGISSSICISLNELIFHAHQTSLDLDFNKDAHKFINQFFISFLLFY